jgi:hypothetical protein
LDALFKKKAVTVDKLSGKKWLALISQKQDLRGGSIPGNPVPVCREMHRSCFDRSLRQEDIPCRWDLTALQSGRQGDPLEAPVFRLRQAKSRRLGSVAIFLKPPFETGDECLR